MKLGRLPLDGPLVLAPMTTYSGEANGDASQGELAHYRRRSRGYGAVMTAACYVHPRGKAFPGQWGCESVVRIPSMRAVAQSIHAGGSKAILQIHHGGRMCPGAVCGGVPLAPSAIPAPRDGAEAPQAMTDDEIAEVIRAFGQAARRAVDSGFDAVEIHGANTYLLQQFVSPHSNRREDAWGTDRTRFSIEVLRAVKQHAPNLPVGYRFSPEELETPGIRLEDTTRLLDRLCEEGLDFLHISLRHYAQLPAESQSESATLLSRCLAAIGGRVPLIAVGSVRTAKDVAACLEAGAAAVAIGKAGITDPDFPEKIGRQQIPDLLFPREGAASRLSLPQGLVDRILGAPGWFEIEP